MTARSRERGSHAGQSRGYGLPRLPGTSRLAGGSRSSGAPADIPVQPGVSGPVPPGFDRNGQGASGAAMEGGLGTVLPPVSMNEGPGQGPVGGGFSRPTVGAPSGPPSGQSGRSRHRKPGGAKRPLVSKGQKFVVALVATAGVLAWGFVSGFNTEPSAEGTVQNFLLDWQQGDFMQAAQFTTGAGTYHEVAAQLSAAYSDVDASAVYLSMGPVTQHGNTAVASFQATIDLADGSHQWTYPGKFGLTSIHGKWYVNWSPSVINPSLGAGDRLAVVTSYAPRAQVDDASGQPLQQASTDYHIGVFPGRLANAARTANAFSAVTGLNAQQVLGHVQAAPPSGFLSLLTISPADFRSLWPRLSGIPGLTYEQKSQRLFTTDADDLVGAVGGENATALRNAGVAYEPGDTIGESGLEQTYQTGLLGAPTTSVVVVNPAGKAVSTLWTVRGHAGTAVRTTINGQYQAKAAQVLAAQPESGEIVAVNSATGAITALAAHEASGGVPLPSGGPLDSKIAPGMAFSIVSAAALVGEGVQPDAQLTCYPSQEVGGQTFTYDGQQVSAAGQASTDSSVNGEQGTFASDFASGCGTAFASMSTRLTPSELAATEKSFGIGADWNLPLAAFSGTAHATSAGASLAAEAIGSSGVQMSPLALAMLAAEVDSGTGHQPLLVSSDQPSQWQAPLSSAQLSELRTLMRGAVTSGSAHAANLGGAPVYGQAGTVQTGKNAWLSWFVGYRGTTAIAVLETGTTRTQAASALAASFLSAIG
jgi:cell division protein FtsI/penicillin-binding protein 2